MNEFEMLARQGYPADALMRMAGGDTTEDIRMEQEAMEREMQEEREGNAYRKLCNCSLWTQEAFDSFKWPYVVSVKVKKEEGSDGTAYTLWVDEEVTVEFEDNRYVCALWGEYPGVWTLPNGDPGYPPEPFVKEEFTSVNPVRVATQILKWWVSNRFDSVVETLEEKQADLRFDARREQAE
jgi:hypothetical protein